MGIYDREYYRGETRGSGWLSGAAPACKTIILINVVVFFLQSAIPPRILEDYLVRHQLGDFPPGPRLGAPDRHVPARLASTHHLEHAVPLDGRPGDGVVLRHRDFVAMYLSAAIISTLGWALVDLIATSGEPGWAPTSGMLGASGAVMAVVVVYALYYPRREILLFFILPVEMWLLVVVFLGFQVWELLNPARAPPKRWPRT